MPETIIEPDEQNRPVARGPWTPAEIETLENSFAAGVPDAAIAALLPARTERAVTIKRHCLGLVNYERQTRTKTPADVAKLRRDHDAAIEALEDLRRMVRRNTDRQAVIEYLDAVIKLHR